ncbi:MAG: ABC transporter permease [Bacteroidales bacterium]|jgi:ABC-2 type transport system permease protein|nr:ABC transporter permease [Bacteroidales bacterium]
MLKYLIEKEFKQTFRNSFIPKLIFIFPVVILLLLPWAATQEVKDVRLTVIDNDNTLFSGNLIRKITASGYFILTSVVHSEKEAIAEIEKSNADIMLVLPPRLEQTLVKEGKATVMISANAVNSMNGALGSSYLKGIIDDYAAGIEVAATATPASSSTSDIPPVVSMPAISAPAMRFLFNPNLDYKKFMVPALMVILLTMLAGFLPALNIVSEKEAGTIEQMNVTPVNKIKFILAKLIPYWIIGIFVLSTGILLGYLIYDIYPKGSLVTIYFYAVVYTFVVSGLGLIISNYSNTIQQAIFMIFFFIMIFIIMCGLFTPVKSMPQWAQWIAAFDPLKYFMDVMRSIYLKGSNIREMLPQLFSLTGFAVALNIWAVISYKKSR